ncbi:MAG: AMP-binding protein [Gammaproteobacteria bacterium]
MRDLAGWVERHAACWPDKMALDSVDGGLSYAALAGRIARLADWLTKEQGLAPGSRVAWLGWNSPDLIALLLACAHTRMVLVPLNWRLATAELSRILVDAAIGLLVVDDNCREAGMALAHPRTVSHGRLTRDGAGSLPTDGAAAAPAARDVDPETALLLVYTSGTTGQPRGAMLSQGAVLFNALNAVHMHDLTAADRVLTVLPMFHVGGLNIQTLPALYCGASVCIESRFSPAPTLERIETWRPTLTTLVPAMIAALREHPLWPRADLTALRAVATGSTDVPRAALLAFHERGIPVVQIYGATETGPVAIYQRSEEAYATAGAIGRAGLHTDIRLIDQSGKDVGPGRAGEILVRGPHLASGYWNAAAGGVDALAEDGWFKTGDVAERDDGGLYRFKDRIKHVIISGGENIYPAELERILAASPLLQEAAIAARADERWGEVPMVIAVRRQADVTEREVLALFDGQVARYKRPHGVVFVEALPRTALGKVEVARLRQLARL